MDGFACPLLLVMNAVLCVKLRVVPGQARESSPPLFNGVIRYTMMGGSRGWLGCSLSRLSR